MKFGVREICDVVFRAKSARKIGSRQFYKNEPVLYFDTLKTSTLEGAVTTVYATGGRGNARLVAWDGERTLTFTMEDALISDIGLAILASADLISATAANTIKVHATSNIILEEAYVAGETDDADPVKATADNLSSAIKGNAVFGTNEVTILLKDEDGKAIKVYDNTAEDLIYVMAVEDGEPVSEPYIAKLVADTDNVIKIVKITKGDRSEDYDPKDLSSTKNKENGIYPINDGTTVLIDYYVEKASGVTQVDITPETFGGNFYIEASTLFRDQVSGMDMPAEFIIPNGKVQSNFTFTMASSGDPSTFTFTVDAMPDYTRFDKTKKVLAAIQIITEEAATDKVRKSTDAGEEA